MYDPKACPILAVTNRKLCTGDFLKQVEKAAGFGVKAIILREKDLSPKEYEALAAEVLNICQRNQVPCILHSFPEAAKNLKADKIHLPLPVLREQAGKLSGLSVIGASVHSPGEAREAELLGATYLTAGHIFATDCKKGVPPRGLAFLEEVVKSTSLPVYAIGGITPENTPLPLRAGAKGICVMSGMMRL